jgi:hypothetical protein
MKTKVGVISCNQLKSFIYDEINQGIDITFEEFYDDLLDQGLSEEEIEKNTDRYEKDNSTILIGDWKKVNKKYEIDKNGPNGFSATYNDNIICVEYSKDVKKRGLTSPCYVMADGSGPCGDLSLPGDFDTFSLPGDFFGEDE